MKKKIINGIMMVALVAATSTSFVSCKDTNEDVKVELQGEYTKLLTQLNNLEKQYGDLNGEVSKLKTKVNNMAGDIETLQTEVDLLEAWVVEAFNNLVTSASINASYNNWTGSINIPGAEPLMLISNYGKATEEGVFPSVKDKNGNQISWAENDEIGSGKNAKVNITEDGNVNVTLNGGFAGYLYASVNRFFNEQKLQDSDIDPESVFDFELVDSRGKAVDGLMIANVEKDGAPTNDLLTWGWTRADENNMFKFGVAYAGSDVSEYEPAKIDLSKFKEDLKAVWAARNTATGTSKQALGKLAADLYYNLATKNTKLPKYRLMISWEDKLTKQESKDEDDYKADAATAIGENGNGDVITVDATKAEKTGRQHFITANEDILFATFKPLSFNSGEVLAAKVGQYVGSANKTIEKSEVLWNKIFNKVKAQLPNLSDDQITKIVATGNLKNGGAGAPEWWLDTNIPAGTADAWDPGNDIDLTAVISPLNTSLDNVKAMFTQLNALKEKLNGSTITNWVKKFTNKFNTLFENNAQQMLEPVLLVIDKNGNVNRVSGIESAPYVAEGEITLDPTSYSAEIFAPAYAKYVGCDKITENGFNEILFANDADLKFTPKSGETYEIVYEAVDFFGNTRKHTYYIQGK